MDVHGDEKGGIMAKKNSLRTRKVLGGAMRQIGYMAAAGIYAIENNIDRLKNDHLRAKEIGQKLVNKHFVKKVEVVETNIIVFEINNAIKKESIIQAFNRLNIKFDWYSMGLNKIRIVTHLNYCNEKHAYLLNSLENIKI